MYTRCVLELQSLCILTVYWGEMTGYVVGYSVNKKASMMLAYVTLFQ